MERIVLPPKYRERLLDRFLMYVKVDTTSDERVPEGQCPTTACQFDLAHLLAAILRGLGVRDVCVSDQGYVYGTVPESLPDGHPAKGKVPVIGLMSHLDTSQDQPGKDVKPRVIVDYQGQDIPYPDDPALVLRPSENPELLNCKGCTIVTAGGKTLLGADDKAGIAEIVTIVEYLVRENIPHGEVRICFNPDEETRRGTDHLDLEKFPVQYAYTLDGGRQGEIEDECFNAKTARVVIKGVDVHPGYGKGKMVNAFRVFAWIVDNLPEDQLPETTEGRQPYRSPDICLSLPTVGKFEIDFLLRAFTKPELDDMESLLRILCHHAEMKFDGAQVTIDVKQDYENMKSVLDQHPLVMELLESACRRQGITPVRKSIRGGTDGSALTLEYGVPTPNMWSGAMNWHSKLEWVPLEWMVSAAETTLKMLTLWVERSY